MDSTQAYNLFKQSILALSDLPEELIESLFGISRQVRLEKGEQFLMAGEVSEYVGFNLDGIFRLYYIDGDGNDFTKSFSTPGRFVISYSALVQHRPSYFSIEAVSDAQILKFQYTEWMKLVEKDSRWYPFLFKLVESVYIVKEMREKAFLLDDATSRYLSFQNEFPGLEQQLKLYHVASYLGITPEALSRIRKKLK